MLFFILSRELLDWSVESQSTNPNATDVASCTPRLHGVADSGCLAADQDEPIASRSSSGVTGGNAASTGVVCAIGFDGRAELIPVPGSTTAVTRTDAAGSASDSDCVVDSSFADTGSCNGILVWSVDLSGVARGISSSICVASPNDFGKLAGAASIISDSHTVADPDFATGDGFVDTISLSGSTALGRHAGVASSLSKRGNVAGLIRSGYLADSSADGFGDSRSWMGCAATVADLPRPTEAAAYGNAKEEQLDPVAEACLEQRARKVLVGMGMRIPPEELHQFKTQTFINCVQNG